MTSRDEKRKHDLAARKAERKRQQNLSKICASFGISTSVLDAENGHRPDKLRAAWVRSVSDRRTRGGI